MKNIIIQKIQVFSEGSIFSCNFKWPLMRSEGHTLLQGYLWNLFLINYVEDSVVFLAWKVFNFYHSYLDILQQKSASHFREITIENSQFFKL